MGKVFETTLVKAHAKSPASFNLRGFYMEAEVGIEPAFTDLQSGA